ncbi:hypothetical protein [Candidatus Binatus sp.]|uniref:hypothetical protein n=1 Tax=Candidatus Binatus sp. TaxID=2811406 RepID=UPI003BAF7854
MTDSEDNRKAQASDDRAEGQAAKGRVFEEFCADAEGIESLGVTQQELQALSRASLLGILDSKEDVMFILRQIRESMKREELGLVPPGSAVIAGGQVDAPTRDFGKITETIRSAALAKLDELDLKAARRRSSVVGRLESAVEGVTTMLSRVQSLVAQVARRRSVSSRPA